MRQSRKSRPKLSNHKQENWTIRAVDDLAEFDKFKEEILPMLKKAISESWSAEKIYKMAEAHAAARNVTIALTDQDSGKAMTAIKELMDRSKGKATEKQEITHSYSKLSDEELDALIDSQKKDLADDDASSLN